MDLEALDSWASLSCALAAVGILLCTAKLLGGILVGLDTSIHLQLIVGMNCVGLLGLVCGWLGQPVPTLLLTVLACGFAAHCVVWRRTSRVYWKSLLTRVASVRVVSVRVASLLVVWTPYQFFGIAALLITLGPALTFPSGWDELVYHIELPRRWLHAGSLTVQADLPYSALPSLPEIICWLVAPIEHLVTPRLLGWFMWVNGIFVLRDSLRRIVPSATAEVLVWAVAASRVSLMISANFYVESFLWADTAALCSLLLASKAIDGRSFFIAGIIVGAAVATKMTAVGLAAFLPIAWWLVQSHSSVSARQVAFGLCIAGLFALPFYLRAWVLCGNPFSPYFAAWFSDAPEVQLTSVFHHELAIGNFGIAGWQGFAAAPFALAFAREVYDGTFGIQWIVVLVCSVLAGKSALSSVTRRDVIAALALCAWLYALWFLSSQQARFGVPLLLVATFACARYIDELKRGVKRALLVCIGVLTLLSVPWTNAGYYLDSWLCVLRISAPVDYIRAGVGDSYADLAAYLDAEIPRDAKVVTLFEHRLAYLPPGVEIATPFFQTKYFAPPTIPAAMNDVLEQLQQQNVKYVVLTLTPAGPDLSQHFIAAQQEWFRGIDACLAAGELRVYGVPKTMP